MAVTETKLGELGVVLGGEQVETGETYEVRSPYDGAAVALVHRAGPDEVERAIAGAVAAFETTRHLPSWQREDVLKKIAQGILARRDELAEVIALEAGKPIKIARLEVDRAAFTFTIAAEESKRIYGEIVPLDWLPGNENRVAHIRRVPLGPIAGISPFNFPLKPRRAQGRAGAGCGEPDHPPSRVADAGQLTDARAHRARSRLARGRDRRIAVVDRHGAAARGGRPDQAPDVHRQPRGRLGPEGPCRAEARHARARGQRRGDRQRRCRRRVRRGARRVGGLRVFRGRRASRCSACSCTRRSTTSSRPTSSVVSRL